MTKLETIVLLLPIVFMIHEYEEIIMFQNWLGNNRNELKRRFPKFEQFLAHRGHFDYSTATFAVGTAHEFILISAISFFSIWLDAYQWWFAAFAGYSVHLIVHLAQWAIYRKYIPRPLQNSSYNLSFLNIFVPLWYETEVILSQFC